MKGDDVKSKVVLSLALAGVMCVTAWGQADPVPASRPAIVQEGERVLEVSVIDTALLALRNNFQINVGRFTPMIAEEAVREAKGPFDVVFSWSGSVDNNHQMPSSALSGADMVLEDNVGYHVTLGKRFVTGAELSLDYDGRRYATNSEFFDPNRWEMTLGITLKQPLLRGTGITYNRSQIATAENSLESARHQLVSDAITVVQRALGAYWNLVFAIEDLRVKTESLSLSEQVLRENKIKFSAGVIPEIEVEGAKASVEENRENIQVARATIRDRSDQLRNLLGFPKHEALAEVLLLPKDRPGEPETPEISLNHEISMALQNRPDLKEKKSDLRNNDIQIAVAKNELFPTLDIEGTYQINGIAGNAYRPARADLYNTETREVMASLKFSFPLQNRTARARRNAAVLAKRQSILDLWRLEQDIITQVRSAVRAIYTNGNRIKARKQSVIFNQKNLVSEQVRKDAGDSTSLDVLKAKEQLTAAETRLIEAKIELRLSLINLQVAKGVLVTDSQVYIGPIERRAKGMPSSEIAEP